MKNLGKRIKSFVLICSLMVSMLAVTTSCGSAESKALTMGQWLTMVNDAFGMTSYTSVAPYFSTVKEDDPYFSAVQIAAEWDVIDPEKNPDLDVDAELTWRDALVTLVNVGKFVDDDATDKEKIDYAIEHFDSDIRDYWLDRVIKTNDAADLLTTAQEQWASATYDEENTVQEAEYNEEVNDYTSPDNFVSDYEISDDGTISMPEEQAGDIEEGDVCVLPTTDGNGNSVTFKADTVTSKDGKVYITTSEDNLKLEDVYESLNIQETFVPDMENVVIRDANGNILVDRGEATASQNQSQKAATMTYQGDRTIHADPTAVKVSQEIEVGGFTIAYDFDLNGSLDFNASLTSDNLFGSEKKNGPELKAGITLGLSDVEVTNEIDYGLGGLNSAAVKVDYQSKIAEELTLSGDILEKNITAFKGIGKSYLYELVASSSYASYSADSTSTTMTIATITLYSAGIASVTLDVNLTISAEGKASVSVTEYGQKGIEYRNGNVRAIKNSNRVIDASIEGKAEATIGVGPALHVWGVSDAIIGFQVAAGVGAKASFTLHLADDQNHLIEETAAGLAASAMAVASLEGATTTASAAMITAAAAAAGANYTPPTDQVECHIDTCIEVQIYAIVNLEMTPDCLVDQLLKNSVRLKWEICNDSNATLFGLHIDNLDFKSAWENKVSFLDGGQMPECTHDYTPWDDNAEDETEDETEDDTNILEGDQILLSSYSVNGAEGDSSSISVTMIPEGYRVSDLVWSSEDESVASVSSSGAIKLLSEGSTIIKVRTKDNKYSVTCAVSVSAPMSEGFDPL